MRKLDPAKLSVEYRNATPTTPILGRRYTLTHSDVTGDLFLTIGTDYAWDKIGPMRDEVLAEWRSLNTQPVFWVQVLVADPQTDLSYAATRNQIFRRELPLALEAIRYGDRAFFTTYPVLDEAPLVVTFHSSYPEYRRTELWGRPADYWSDGKVGSAHW